MQGKAKRMLGALSISLCSTCRKLFAILSDSFLLLPTQEEMDPPIEDLRPVEKPEIQATRRR